MAATILSWRDSPSGSARLQGQLKLTPKLPLRGNPDSSRDVADPINWDCQCSLVAGEMTWMLEDDMVFGVDWCYLRGG